MPVLRGGHPPKFSEEKLQIVSRINATSITDKGSVYEPDQDGTFTVPDHVGRELVSFSHWVELHVRLAELDAEKAAKDADPSTFAARLTELEKAVSDLIAGLEELQKAFAGAGELIESTVKKAFDALPVAVIEPQAKAPVKRTPRT